MQAAAAAARALRVNVTVAAGDPLPHLLPPPQISCDQEMVFFMETVLAMLLLVGLVWVLNRDGYGQIEMGRLVNQLSIQSRLGFVMHIHEN